MSNLAPLPATATDSAARRWRIAAAVGRVLAWLLAALLALLLLAWLGLHWAILPHIDRWRPQIESQASAALGVPVRIGHIEVRASGLTPTIDMSEVALLDTAGRPALLLARVVATVSARSVLASMGSFDLRLASLQIEGAQVEIRRDPSGRVFVAGLELGAAVAGSNSAAADWVFSQGEFAIRGASLRWTDELRGAPPLELSAVDLVVRNTLRKHDLRLEATPPPAWGERFTLHGEFTQPLLAETGQWQRWSGTVSADAPSVDASELRRYLDLPFELSLGVGAVRASLDIRDGAAAGVTLDLALSKAEFRLDPEQAPLLVEQVKGKVAAQGNADAGTVSLRGFEFRTGDGVHWPPGDLDFKWTRGADGALTRGELGAARLDLAVLGQIASRLPLSEALRRLLAETAPKGIANDVKADWNLTPGAPARYTVQATIDGLSLASRPAVQGDAVVRPGLRNATLALNATERGGTATLALKNGALELPGVFAEPVLPLDTLQAKLGWRVEPRGDALALLQIELSDARASNADGQAELNGVWKATAGAEPTPGARPPGVLQLDAVLTRVPATRIARYLPLAVPAATRRSVERALQAGSFSRASVRIDGDLRHFPFPAGTAGEFRAAITADDLTLAFAPDSAWPPLTRLNGEIVLDRAALEFRQARARIFGFDLSAPSGGIANLADKPLLKLDLQGRGPVADVLRFINTTPVGGWIDGVLSQASATGNGDLKLALALPLNEPSQATVDGSLQLAGSDLRIQPELPPFMATRGRVAFTNKSVTIADTTTRVLGGEAAIDGGTQADGSLRFNARGGVTAEALRGRPELARLAGSLSGKTSYRLVLGLGRGGPEIDLTSDLVGMALNLPAPLAKSADAALPLHLQTTLDSGGAAGTLRDTLRIELGSVLQAQYQREQAGTVTRVLRGGVGVFEPAPTPASGVSAAATLASLDLDQWEATASAVAGPGGVGSGAMAQAGYAPTQIGLKAQQLRVGGRTLTGLSADLAQRDGQWRATLKADQVAGRVDYRPPGAGAGAGGDAAGRVFARLTRLSLPASDAAEASSPPERPPAEEMKGRSRVSSLPLGGADAAGGGLGGAQNLPALDIVIDELERGDRRLGRLELQAVNRAAPARAWELTLLKLTVPEATLGASGRWAAADRQSAFKFELDISDGGALLARFGSPGAVRGGSGRIEGTLGWPGSPFAPDLGGLNGQLNVAIESGQFLQINPGGARLLGLLNVFSLQSLGRRLTGDFRDVFTEGLAFDSITGDVAIQRGVASTSNLLMSSPQASVRTEGSADIARETQDLRVVVAPEINTSTATLAATVINPAIGLGAYFAQRLLRDSQAITREFRVTGPWADPQVETVGR